MLIGLTTLYIIIGFSTVVLHLFGLYSLRKNVTQRNHLHIILIHLSSCVITMACLRFLAILYLIRFNGNYIQAVAMTGYQVIFTFSRGFDVCYALIMTVLVLDPFLMVVLKTSYTKHVTKTKITLLLGCCWVVSCIYSLVFFTAPFELRFRITTKFIFPVLSTLFVVFSIVCYAVIYNNTRFRSNSDPDERIRKTSLTSRATRPALKFRVPMLITLTFFVFVALPALAQAVIRFKPSTEFMLGGAVFYSIGFVLDATVYLLLHPSARTKLRALFHKQKISNISTQSNVTRTT